MTRTVRLTDRARATLFDIAVWTADRFGPLQARRYAELIADRLEGVAEGRVHSRSAALITGRRQDKVVRYARVGEHFAITEQFGDTIFVLDFVHSRSNLAQHMADAIDAPDK